MAIPPLVSWKSKNCYPPILPQFFDVPPFVHVFSWYFGTIYVALLINLPTGRRSQKLEFSVVIIASIRLFRLCDRLKTGIARAQESPCGLLTEMFLPSTRQRLSIFAATSCFVSSKPWAPSPLSQRCNTASVATRSRLTYLAKSCVTARWSPG